MAKNDIKWICKVHLTQKQKLKNEMEKKKMMDLILGIATLVTVFTIIVFAGLNLLWDKKN